MRFTKMQGAGNDFVLVKTNNRQRDWSTLAIAVCDRNYGIGADGLVLLMPSSVADLRMRIFNADGSEADACGNGLRCLVKYYLGEEKASSKSQNITIETMAGIRPADISIIGANSPRIRIGMGKPELGTGDINTKIQPDEGKVIETTPLLTYAINVGNTEITLNPISVGNPHAVYFIQEPVSDFPLSQLGPLVEEHRLFPKKVNFEVVRILDRQNIEARVWERGVGETLACGSGACAVAVAARQHDYTDNTASIKLPGGTLETEWDGHGEVFLSGPAESVFSGEWPDNGHN